MFIVDKQCVVVCWGWPAPLSQKWQGNFSFIDMQSIISKWPLHWALGGNDFTGGLEQNAYELEKFCEFIKTKNIKSYTEIGIAAGLLLRFMKDEMNLNVFGITYEERESHIGLPVFYGKSQDQEVVKIASFSDLYFIDADHSYEAVKSDFNNYKGKCTYMAFHDILGLRSCEGAKVFWDELKSQYEYWEFICPDINIASGIGVIKIN